MWLPIRLYSCGIYIYTVRVLYIRGVFGYVNWREKYHLENREWSGKIVIVKDVKEIISEWKTRTSDGNGRDGVRGLFAPTKTNRSTTLNRGRLKKKNEAEKDSEKELLK